MTKISLGPATSWRDEHRTKRLLMPRTIAIQEHSRDEIVTTMKRRRNLIGLAIDTEAQRGTRLCVAGSGWSQSDLFQKGATLVVTGRDQAIWEIPAEAMSDGAEREARHYVLATGGTSVAQMMSWLDKRGLSLRTVGSHKGQTLAGMVATGSHGTFLNETGFETHVCGLLISTGEGKASWLEDEQRPVLKRGFVKQFASFPTDDLFDDAIIHLGGMGYVSAILLEVEDQFLLGYTQKCMPLPERWADHIASADFDTATAALNHGRAPLFYELTFDPFRSLDGDVLQTVYYLEPPIAELPEWAQGPLDTLDVLSDVLTQSAGEAAFGGDTGGFNIIDVGKMVFDEFKENIPEENGSSTPITLHQSTNDWVARELLGVRVDTFNAAISVPIELLPQALNAGFKSADGFLRHFVYTVRFARKSRGSMSFLRFDMNAIINIDGLTKEFMFGSHSDDAARAFVLELESRNIPYSMHWGKDIPSDRNKISNDFGDAVDRWKAARADLLPADRQNLFTSPLLRQSGLAN